MAIRVVSFFKAQRLRKARIELAGIPDLDLCVAHRTLPLPLTQRTCHLSRPQQFKHKRSTGGA